MLQQIFLDNFVNHYPLFYISLIAFFCVMVYFVIIADSVGETILIILSSLISAIIATICFVVFGTGNIDFKTQEIESMFRSISLSNDFSKDQNSLNRQFYSEDSEHVFNKSNLNILSSSKMEVLINDIPKELRKNKGSNSSDFNLCKNISMLTEKYHGVIEDPNSCLSNGSAKIFFNVKPREQQSEKIQRIQPLQGESWKTIDSADIKTKI